MRCREVRKHILSVAKDGCEEMNVLVSRHLSECDTCRSLYAACHEVEKVLLGEKDRLAELVRGSQAGRSRILGQISSRQTTRGAWRWRPVWISAAALVLLAIAGASALLFRGRDGNGRDDVGTPMTTWSVAAAASSQTVRELVEVVGRHEAPSLDLPYTPPAAPDEPLFPRLLQRCSRESQDTLRMIAQSKTKLTRREGT